MLHKLGDGVLERLKRDGVVVVQHQEELATGAAGQVVDQLCEDSREGEALQTMWRGEVRLDTGPKRGITGLEGGQQDCEGFASLLISQFFNRLSDRVGKSKKLTRTVVALVRGSRTIGREIQ